MTDTLEKVMADLADRATSIQVEWAHDQTRWDDGTVVVHREGEQVVLTQLGRVEAEDRRERFATEAEAAAALRRRYLTPPICTFEPGEQDDVRERMQRRAEQIKAELREGS